MTIMLTLHNNFKTTEKMTIKMDVVRIQDKDA